MNKNKGFTLIELLVVIAIIGILASVVLASLNTARAKGADAAVKSNLNNVRAQAELIYDTDNGSYLGVCGHATVIKAIAAANTASGKTAVCNSIAGSWALSSPLKSADNIWWCVDSTGTSSQKGAALGTATACQ